MMTSRQTSVLSILEEEDERVFEKLDPCHKFDPGSQGLAACVRCGHAADVDSEEECPILTVREVLES